MKREKLMLDNSLQFNRQYVREFPSVNALANHIFETHVELRTLASNKNAPKKFRIIEGITNVLLNLLVANRQGTLLRISKDKLQYVNPNRYGAMHYRYNIIVTTTNAMRNSGLINEFKGFYDKTRGEGLQTRLAATDKLIAMFRDYSVTDSNVYVENDGDSIMLRNEKKSPVDYQDTEFTIRARKELQSYNAWLDKQGVSIPVESNQPHLSAKMLVRIFNVDFEHGGRLYAGYQGMPYSDSGDSEGVSCFRKDITIAGASTVELDFASLHPTMLYNMEGIDYALKCMKAYAIGSIAPKKLIKPLMLVCFNASDIQSTWKAWLREVRTSKRTRKQFAFIPQSELDCYAKDIYIKFQATHAPITKYMFSGIGKTLQFHDSNIMMNILNSGKLANVPMLPVHDSVIVKASQADKAMQIMTTAYGAYMQEQFKLTFKPSIIVEIK